jgi:hypothetical protein
MIWTPGLNDVALAEGAARLVTNPLPTWCAARRITQSDVLVGHKANRNTNSSATRHGNAGEFDAVNRDADRIGTGCDVNGYIIAGRVV